jgi:hypothetical protein
VSSCGAAWGGVSRTGQLLQLLGAVLHDFTRTKTQVQQALDHAQLLHLLGW